MTIVTVMLLVIFGMVFHFTRENMRSQSIRAMEMTMEPFFQREQPGKRPNKIMMPTFLVEITPSGETQIHSHGYFAENEEAVVDQLLALVRAREEKIGELPAYQLRFHKTATPDGERIVFVDISVEMETVNSLIKTCVLIGVLSFGAFLIISILLAKWAVRPVAQAWDQQRQFVADASHELKTPLTVIMTNAELLNSGEYAQPEQNQLSQNILTMSRQMRTLVESLLELARVDNGTAKMTFSDVDFSALTEDALLRFEAVYFEKGRNLEGEITDGLRVRGSYDHLQRVVDILLDNGAKYGSSGSTIRVKLYRQGSQCILRVDSEGEAISKEDLRNIFKRFYRTDKARSRDGSYGLGLSIAQSILSEHRGKIWAESAGGINTFFVQMNLL